MKFYGKADTAARSILTAFRDPGTLPAKLAPIFIHRKGDAPCRKWSWSNQFIVAINGHADARGFRQWEQAKRHVRKGEKGFPILVPCKRTITKADPETGDERKVPIVYGFRHAIVFGLDQTEGEPLESGDPALDQWLTTLPLRAVADDWGLSVETFSGQGAAYAGYYAHGKAIALGVENLATWAHELIHAADHRNGTDLRNDQPWMKETVAELGGAILLQCVGMPNDADLGGCWDYINRYSTEAKIEPITACERVLKCTCDAVALILDTADSLETVNA